MVNNKLLIFASVAILLSASVTYGAERLTDRTAQGEAPASNDIALTVDVSVTTDSAVGTSKSVTWANVGEYFKSLFYTETEIDDSFALKNAVNTLYSGLDESKQDALLNPLVFI